MAAGNDVTGGICEPLKLRFPGELQKLPVGEVHSDHHPRD